jgi:glycosyltransferase involved in cell wall biosynthesis
MINGTLLSNHNPDSSKMFHIIVPTYGGGPKLEVIINCFFAQTCQDYHLTIISDGPEPETEYQLAKYYNNDNFSYYQLDKRYNDWGHTPREYGIYKSECLFTIMTGYDNYYVPTFIEEFKKIVMYNTGIDFIFCDMIHNHVINGSSYNGHIDSKMECGHIDIGNFATNTQLLKNVGFKSKSFAADWDLVKSIMPHLNEINHKAIKIQQTLYVHN